MEENPADQVQEESTTDQEVAHLENRPPGLTHQEIAELVCKTISLILFAILASALVLLLITILMTIIDGLLGTKINEYRLGAIFILLIPTCALGLVGLLYWKHSTVIASRMVSSAEAPATGRAITVEDLMMIAFSTSGIFVFIDGARTLTGILHLAYAYSFTPGEFWAHSQTQFAWAQIVLAIWLILGSRGIVKTICWLRTAGVPELQET